MGSYAQLDNLEPESGFFSSSDTKCSYYPKVRNILCNNLEYYTEARVVVLPPFSQEYLISLDSKNGQTYLTYRIAKDQIWHNRKKSIIECENHEIVFDPSVAMKIHELFYLATSRAKYSNDRILEEDGTSYIFVAFETGFGLRSGFTKSPKAGNMQELVKITDWLVNCAKEGKILNQKEMDLKIIGLINVFKKE